MARKKSNQGDAAAATETNHADAGESLMTPSVEQASEPSREAAFDRLSIAQQRLTRMEETNRMCFRFRNDLASIERELVRTGFNDAEVEHIMEPKGARSIPGFGFAEIERQRQYVNFLTSRRGTRTDDGFAAKEEQRRDAVQEPELG